MSFWKKNKEKKVEAPSPAQTRNKQISEPQLLSPDRINQGKRFMGLESKLFSMWIESGVNKEIPEKFLFGKVACLEWVCIWSQ